MTHRVAKETQPADQVCQGRSSKQRNDAEIDRRLGLVPGVYRLPVEEFRQTKFPDRTTGQRQILR